MSNGIYDYVDDVKERLAEKDKRIAELEKELKLCQKLHTELFLSYEKLKDKKAELEHLIGYPRFVDGYDKNDNEINKVEFVTYKESFNEVLEQNKKLKQENQVFKEEIKILKGKLNE